MMKEIAEREVKKTISQLSERSQGGSGKVLLKMPALSPSLSPLNLFKYPAQNHFHFSYCETGSYLRMAPASL